MDNQQNDNSGQDTQQSAPEPGGCKCGFDKEACLAMLKSVSEKALAIVTKPTEIWSSVKEETSSIKDIYKNYLYILVAIPAVFGFIGALIAGRPFFGSLLAHLVIYGLMLGSLYVWAFVLDKLAPKFEGTTDLTSVFKLVAYSATPGCLAGILALAPGNMLFGLLQLLAGLYGLYLLYQGIPVMTNVPEPKRLAYLGVSIAAIVLIFILITAVLGSMMVCGGASVAPSSMIMPDDFTTWV